MDSEVVVILDSDDEGSETLENNSIRAIVIDSDDEEFEKNKRMEAVIMNNVKAKLSSSRPAHINKVFQDSTTTLKRKAVARKVPQPKSPSNRLTQVVQIQNGLDIEFLTQSIDTQTADSNFEKFFRVDTKPHEHSIQKDRAREKPRQTKKPKVERRSDDEDNGVEEDLEYYISFMKDKRKYRVDDDTSAPKVMHMQCPICYLLFPKAELPEHAAECDGKKAEKGVVRKSISAAVLLEQQERAKKSHGIEEMAPTNYYLDSDMVATNGSGFNNEVTGLNWELAGQTRFG